MTANQAVALGIWAAGVALTISTARSQTLPWPGNARDFIFSAREDKNVEVRCNWLIAVENVKQPLTRLFTLKFHQTDLNGIFPRWEIGHADGKIGTVDFVAEGSLISRRVRYQKYVAGSVII